MTWRRLPCQNILIYHIVLVFFRDICAVTSPSRRPERHRRRAGSSGSCGAFITPSIIHSTNKPSRPGTDLGSGVHPAARLAPAPADWLLWDLSGPAERSLQQKKQHLILQLRSIKGQRLKAKDTNCVFVCVCAADVSLLPVEITAETLAPHALCCEISKDIWRPLIEL